MTDVMERPTEEHVGTMLGARGGARQIRCRCGYSTSPSIDQDVIGAEFAEHKRAETAPTLFEASR